MRRIAFLARLTNQYSTIDARRQEHDLDIVFKRMNCNYQCVCEFYCTSGFFGCRNATGMDSVIANAGKLSNDHISRYRLVSRYGRWISE